jgi:hypothetical protein
MNRPLSLIIVSGLFILAGAEAAWHTITESWAAHIVINPSLVCLFVGIGLFRRRHVWRYIGLACVWFSIIALVTIAATIYAFPKNVTFNFLAAWTGLPLKVTSPTLGLVILLPVFIWMLLVLARKDICDSFSSRDA